MPNVLNETIMRAVAFRDSYRRGRSLFYARHNVLAVPLRPFSSMGDRVVDGTLILARCAADKIRSKRVEPLPEVNFSASAEGVATETDYSRFRFGQTLLWASTAVITIGACFSDDIRAALAEHPFLVNVGITGIRHFLGDLVAQKAEGTKYSLSRGLKFFALGTGYGPLLHLWYGVINHVPVTPAFGFGLLRSIIDNIVYGTPMIGVHFFLVGRLVNGRSLASIRKEKFVGNAEADSEFLKVAKRKLKVWIPIQMINQWLVPFELRLTLTNVLAFFWTCYLNFKAAEKLGDQNR